MPTDDERRAVAERLRGIDAERLDRVYGMDGEDGECKDPGVANTGRDLMLGAIAEAVGMHFAPYYFDAAPLRDRLADLIEPDCGTGETASSRVLECDRDALLALADDVDGAVKDAGDAWPLADALRDIARRIREACGEGE